MVEILYFDGCPNHEGLETHVRTLLADTGVELPITVRRIDSEAEARAERFLGSPTIRVNGVDVDPTAATHDTYGIMCRVYPTDDGPRGTPPDGWILAALHRKSSAGRAG